MSLKTASSKDAGRYRSQKSTKDARAACLTARDLSETTSRRFDKKHATVPTVPVDGNDDGATIRPIEEIVKSRSRRVAVTRE